MGYNLNPMKGMLYLLTRYSIMVTGAMNPENIQDAQSALAVIGYLIEGRNKCTGKNDDIYYLKEDAQANHQFAGILGRNLNILDSLGTPLHIGDTVLLHNNGMEVETPVLESFQEQWVEEMGAVKNLGFQEALHSGFLEDCDLSIHSCLDAFRESPLNQSAASEEAQEDSSYPQL